MPFFAILMHLKFYKNWPGKLGKKWEFCCSKWVGTLNWIWSRCKVHERASLPGFLSTYFCVWCNHYDLVGFPLWRIDHPLNAYILTSSISCWGNSDQYFRKLKLYGNISWSSVWKVSGNHALCLKDLFVPSFIRVNNLSGFFSVECLKSYRI